MRRVFRIGGVLAAFLALAALIERVTAPTPSERPAVATDEPAPGDALPFALAPLSWDQVPGWPDTDPSAALVAFVSSCEAQLARGDGAPANPVENTGHPAYPSLAGTVADWRGPCEAAAVLTGRRTAPGDLRAFVEAAFVPVEVTAPDTLFTGYFEPSYPAARAPTGRMTAPVLTRPDDLVTVDLGAFKRDLKGQDVVGRIEGTRLVPYDDHAAIVDAPPPSSDVLGYVDPNDLLFLQIQGSGRLVFPDGEVVRAGYAAKNGRAYVAVGRTLVAEGHMPLEDVSMQSIAAWLDRAPAEDAATVRHSNPSYVFFRALGLPEAASGPGPGPLGAQGVALTAGRSLAVDRRYYAMGMPVWLVTEATPSNPALARMMVTQDTGGAIRGPVRGDVFYGSDEAAAALAGTMNTPGRLILLLPEALAARLLGAQA